MTTPTPRTDAAHEGHERDYYRDGFVDVEFARQLERELAAAKEELAQARLFIAETGDKLPDSIYIETIEREGLAEDCKRFATGEVCAKYLDVKWQTERAIKAEEELAQEREANAKLRAVTPHAEMVNRFLAWTLPQDFSPDCGISFDCRPPDARGYRGSWPIGTNLLTADQALAMFRHCVPTVTQDSQFHPDWSMLEAARESLREHWQLIAQERERAERAEARAEKNARGWQPIETAPTDGTKILGYRAGKIGVAYRVQRDDGEAWSFGGASGHVDLWPSVKPEFWMPMPPEPAATAGEKK